VVEWNRLADATEQNAVRQLCVVTIGEPADRAWLNRAIDSAPSDWILLVREREVVSDALADEIRAVLHEGKARGFRIRSTVMYCGKPLRIGRSDGEIRLFHRRYYMRFAKTFSVQGTVVRLQEPLRSVSFESADAHRAQLAKRGVPHSALRHVLLFLRYAAEARTLDRNTLRYLWIEAAYDQNDERNDR
jgi:hypothetical protein